MRIGELNHWDVIRLDARLSEIRDVLEHASEELEELQPYIVTLDAEVVEESLAALQEELEVVAEDIAYVRARLLEATNTALEERGSESAEDNG